MIIGHTEDACPEFLNNVFLVSAQVLDDKGQMIEKFTTLTYAGYLPGYTMGYNHHGLIYTVNTIFPKVTLIDCTRESNSYKIQSNLLCKCSYMEFHSILVTFNFQLATFSQEPF